MESKNINQEAIRLLDEALLTSSLIKDKERTSGSIKDDHYYPVTREETEKMAALLQQASEIVEDSSEQEYSEKHAHVEGIVDFSLSRHRSWNWGILLGVAIFAALLIWGYASQRKGVKDTKARMAVIKDWPKADTLITWESANAATKYDNEAYTHPNRWKAMRLGELKKWTTDKKSESEKYLAMADTASTKDMKKKYMERVKNYSKEADELQEKFDKLSAAGFKDTQKIALETYKGFLRSNRSSAGFFIVFFALIALLMALYIWTGNPYGYELTRTRTRDKVISWVRKICFSIAGFCFGTGLMMQLFADDNMVEYVYSSGRREVRSEANVAGTAMNVMWKIILMVTGIVIFVGISLLVMAIEALGGLPEKFREIKSGAL